MVKITRFSAISNQWAYLDPALHVDLKGKSVIVGGANAGIGFETAKHFATMGPSRLILACRSEKKGAEAVAAIERETGYTAELRLVDLSDFASVVEFATKLKGDTIDILVANAAVAQRDYKTTKDGWEEMLKVNHLSTALLSLLLLPNLRKAAIEHGTTSRLVIVTSDMHHFSMFNAELFATPNVLQKLSDKEFCTPAIMASRYHDTKMLNVLFTRAFAEHLTAPGGVVVNTVNPGFCVSELRRNLPLSGRIMARVMEMTLGRTAEQGARQLLWAALGPDGKEGPHLRYLNGAYVSIASTVEPSDFVISKEGYDAQQKLWAETIDILSKVAPPIKEITKSS